MGKIVGLDGKTRPLTENDFKESEVINGRKMTLTIYEDIEKTIYVMQPGTKDLLNPFALENFLLMVLEDIKKSNIKAMIFNTVKEIAQQTAETRRNQEIIQAAMNETKR